MNKTIDLANEDNCGVCYSTKYHNPKYTTLITKEKNYNKNNTDLK
jgi:hypothetical protein